jgi:ABC-type polysaccharide/polyol phosphate transport system ATPase subunit
MPSIRFDRVSKTYSRQSRRFFWKHLADWFAHRKTPPFYALSDVSFQIGEGHAVGIVGPNGAGKTTLLNLIAGLTAPEEGTIQVAGRVAAMLELGSGFHPDLTGAENVIVNAALMGLSRQEAGALFDAIVEFSGIGEFIQEPLRTYSMGMILRLGFSVAAHVDPDILLMDEILTVGDQNFQKKCFDRLVQLKQAGKILVAVSHVAADLERLCDSVIWIQDGKVAQHGPAREVLAAYQSQAIPARVG